MEIDVDRLRRDLIASLKAAYFVGGFGAALVERVELEGASDDEIVAIALQKGMNLQKYVVLDTNSHGFTK